MYLGVPVLNGHKAHYDYIVLVWNVSKIKIFIPYRVSKINLRLVSQPNVGCTPQQRRRSIPALNCGLNARNGSSSIDRSGPPAMKLSPVSCDDAPLVAP